MFESTGSLCPYFNGTKTNKSTFTIGVCDKNHDCDFLHGENVPCFAHRSTAMISAHQHICVVNHRKDRLLKNLTSFEGLYIRIVNMFSGIERSSAHFLAS